MREQPEPLPDFAMLRAVEILAQIAEKLLKSAHAMPPPLDVPLVLFNENIMFVVGKTLRANVTKVLGPGYAFPAKGWETYAVRERSGRYLLSALYRGDVLVAVDYALAKPSVVPELSPQSLGEFRLVPGQVAVGAEMASLDQRFVRVDQGPDARQYTWNFELRFRGGVAYVQSSAAVIQRLVLYAVD